MLSLVHVHVSPTFPDIRVWSSTSSCSQAAPSLMSNFLLSIRFVLLFLQFSFGNLKPTKSEDFCMTFFIGNKKVVCVCVYIHTYIYIWNLKFFINWIRLWIEFYKIDIHPKSHFTSLGCMPCVALCAYVVGDFCSLGTFFFFLMSKWIYIKKA